MPGGFQDQGGFETQMWLESGGLMLGFLFLGLCCFGFFYLPVLPQVCVLGMVGHEQLSCHLVIEEAKESPGGRPAGTCCCLRCWGRNLLFFPVLWYQSKYQRE